MRLLTPPGRSAVASIEIVGHDALRQVSNHFRRASRKPIDNLPLHSIAFGNWSQSKTGDNEEGVVVTRLAPTRIEVHCHGGSVAAKRIIADLVGTGCLDSAAETDVPSETANVESEAKAALADVITERAALILSDQFNGAITNSCANIASLIENGKNSQATTLLESLLATYRAGQHLTQPWQIVIAGPANVGKSSLVNAIVGYERAIVFNQPGTTRDVVTALTAIDGWPVEFADTAGLRTADSDIEAMGMQRARARFSDADIAILVVDARLTQAELQSNEDWIAMRDIRPDAILVRNKYDLIEDSKENPVVKPNDAILTSATSSFGIDDLLVAISRAMTPDDVADNPAIGPAMLFTKRQHRIVATALLQLQSGHSCEASRTLMNC